MRFMELDSEGFILHIVDDPVVTMLPVVNRIQYHDANRNPLVDNLGRPLSHHGGRVLGKKPKEHPPELMPREVSDEHFELLVNEGLSGWKDPVKKTGRWTYKWDDQSKKPIKVDTF